MFASKDVFLTPPATGSYQISRSVRLRASASAYFNRTAGAPTSNLKYTMSVWMKRGKLGAQQAIFSSYNGASEYAIGYFDANDKLNFIGDSATPGRTFGLTTAAVYRDPSAWYHIVMVFDSANATVANRCIIYVNGVSQTLTGTTVPLNTPSYFNTNGIVGYLAQNGISSNYNDCYLTEVNFIDGQALTPSSFGEYNTTTGVWQPKRYTGTYGTNGFYLNFSDNSAATAAAIGKDWSGNSNNWTPNNISVTAGSTYDSMIDSPTMYADGGNNRGNYAVLNPINQISTYSFPVTNGNLTASGSSGANYLHALGSIWFDVTDSSGYYFEFDSLANYYSGGGITKQTNINSSIRALTNGGVAGYTWATILIGPNVYAYNNGAGSYATAACTAASGTVFGCFVRGGKVWFRDSTGWLTGNPNTDTSPLYSGLTGDYTFCLTYEPSGTGTGNANFGQRPFTYTPPTGFKALNTQNMPDSTISNGAAYMAASLFTGTSGNVTVSNVVNGVGFQPDFVWGKARSNAQGHEQIDSVRGVNKYLQSNLTNAEGTLTNPPTFNSDGWTSTTDTHTNGYTYVSWQWKANGAAVSNTSGSITSSVSAGSTQGFSVVTYTTAGANGTVGHGLGVAPNMVIVKSRNNASGWSVYHSSVGNTGALNLQATTATSTSIDWWNNTSPTSTVFSFGGNLNFSGWTWVAYCFSAVAGYSAFGSYTGNGSADGPFVYLGFRPRFVLLKSSTQATDWYIYDTSRDTYNVATLELNPNLAAAEQNGTYGSMDINSNGFKLRFAGGEVNVSSQTYIYAAFAENPFKNALAR